MTPPARTGRKTPPVEVATAQRAIQAAPATSAAVPQPVIPPERPVAISRPVKIDRGAPRASVPISVPHVSAVAAA
jgi:hypothetical protein